MLHWLRAWRALPRLERRTLLKAAVINPSMLLVLRSRGTQSAATIVQRLSARRFAARHQQDDEDGQELARRIGASVNRAAVDPVPAVTCLARSLTAQLLLRRRGLDAVLCIGVGRADAGTGEEPDELAFHAWVEVGGVPVNDAPDVAQRFSPFPLERFQLGRRAQA